MSKTDSSKRLGRLDILRGIAALTVVLFHYTAQFPTFYANALPLPGFEYGLYGVHLFFIISGFVILMSMEKRNGKGFIKSRFIRLYPVFWASVLLTSAVLAIDNVIAPAPSALQLLGNLTMLYDYIKLPAIDGVYWSLTYELGFYVMMFGLFRLGGARYLHWVPIWMAAGALIFPWVMPFIPHPLHFIIGINDYAHLFAAGMALYLIRNRGFSWMMAGVLIAVPIIQFQQDGWVGAIATGLALAVMLWGTVPRATLSAAAKPFLWLGSVSYALYLTHQMIGYTLMARLQQAGFSAIASLLITLCLALAISAVLTFWVERPAANKLRILLPDSWRDWRVLHRKNDPKNGPENTGTPADHPSAG